MSSKAASKDGQPITEFWIVNPPVRRMNWGPRLFWTREGMSLYVESAIRKIELNVWHIDLVKQEVTKES